MLGELLKAIACQNHEVESSLAMNEEEKKFATKIESLIDSLKALESVVKEERENFKKMVDKNHLLEDRCYSINVKQKTIEVYKKHE